MPAAGDPRPHAPFRGDDAGQTRAEYSGLAAPPDGRNSSVREVGSGKKRRLCPLRAQQRCPEKGKGGVCRIFLLSGKKVHPAKKIRNRSFTERLPRVALVAPSLYNERK